MSGRTKGREVEVDGKEDNGSLDANERELEDCKEREEGQYASAESEGNSVPEVIDAGFANGRLGRLITGKSAESKGLAVAILERGGVIVANDDGDIDVGDGAGDEDDDDDVEVEVDETVDITSDVSVEGDDNFDSLVSNDSIFELFAVVATKSAASVEEAVGLAFDICCSWIFLCRSLFLLSILVTRWLVCVVCSLKL